MRAILILLLALAGGLGPARAQMSDAQCTALKNLIGCQNRGRAPSVMPPAATVDVVIAGATYSVPLAGLFTLSDGSGANAASIYGAIFPGVTFSDRAATSFTNTNTTAIEQQTGYAAYFRNQASTLLGGHNAVGHFVAGTCEVNDSVCWGFNSLLQDAAARVVGSGTGRLLIGYENDVNVMNPGTQVIGFSVGGNSLAQPTKADGYIVNKLGTKSDGTPIRWISAFNSIDGAANYGLYLGTQFATGTAVPSQLQTFGYLDAASGAKQTVTWQVVSAGGTAAFLSLTSTGGVDVSLNGRALYAGGVNVGSSTLSGSIYVTGLPTCASSPPSSSVCRDTTTSPPTLKVIP